jgi:hypothetical protein
MFVVFCNGGAVTIDELHGQLRDEQWVPVLVKKPKGQEEPVTLLSFQDPATIAKFIKLNVKLGLIPKDWNYGYVFLPPQEVDLIRQRGWQIDKLMGPIRFDKKRFTAGVECVNFIIRPSVAEERI